MIEVNNLVKRYGEHLAVDHLSFTVEDGQIYGFLGPNGAGKSTTMNIITGYLAATEGDVVVDGHNILDEPEAARRCIGYLPEIPPVYPEMTVLEYLRFCAELKKLPKAEHENQISQVLSLTHLEEMAPRLIKNLSKGYRQRVGLAQAILGFPRILILDEPTVGLDPKQIIEIRDLIRQLAKEHTVILSSHILSEVREVCDHILIIQKGRLVACDTPEHLEAHLSGAGTLELMVKATPNEAEQVLSGIAGTACLDSKENGDGTTTLTLSGGKDVREALFFAFADAKHAILEMKTQIASLEDVFLELTEEPADQRNGVEAGLEDDPEDPAGKGEAQDESNL